LKRIKKRRIKRIEAGHEPEEIALMKLFQANGHAPKGEKD
jgi:hypothetical protein